MLHQGLTSHAKGLNAEDHAADYLKKQGFEVLERRYKSKFGEIDLIVKKKNLLCFVEVKVRQTEAEAMESVRTQAQRRIENAALHFIAMNPDYADYAMRFDVIAITKPFQIHHLDNAWLARS